MFYERDMKLGEIIKFTKGVIKRNKGIYVNLFLVYMVWNVITSIITYALPETGGLNFFVTIIIYIISFCVMLGVRKTIYESIYDENYSENFDKNDIIEFVKERWGKAIVGLTGIGIGIYFLAMIITIVPIWFIIYDVMEGGFSFLSFIALLITFFIMYVGFVIFMYYTLEYSLNKDTKMASAEVKSVLKIKGIKGFWTVLPIGLFNLILYLGWFFILFGVSLVLVYMESELMIGDSNISLMIVTIIASIIMCFINIFVQSLWIVKYYNMKNAIVHNINGGKSNTEDVEDNEISAEVNDVKEDVVSSEASDEVNDVKEDVVSNVEQKEEKENSDDKSDIVGESSMWGSSASIEDSIVGSDVKED